TFGILRSVHRHARLVVAGALLLSLAVIAIAWSTHQHHQAQTEALAADRRASAQAAVEQLVADGEDLRDRLSERIAAGQAVAEAGPTAEPGVMQALEETLSTARSHRDAPAPEVPPDADARTLDETRET